MEDSTFTCRIASEVSFPQDLEKSLIWQLNLYVEKQNPPFSIVYEDPDALITEKTHLKCWVSLVKVNICPEGK